MRREREAATQQLEEEAEVSSTGEGLERSPERVCSPRLVFPTPSPERMWLWGKEIRTEEMCRGLRKTGWVRNLGLFLGLERQYMGSKIERSCAVS